MPGAADDLAPRVEALVREVEAGTSAELVVVIAGSSSTYRGVIGWALGVPAVVATAFFCWSPWVFDDTWIPVDVLVASVAVAGLVGTSFRARRSLTSRREQDRCVGLAADAAFWQEAVHATRARTGILVYVSLLERRVEVRADLAVSAAVPAAAWNAAVQRIQAQYSTPDAFASAFGALGAVLAEHLPRAHDDENESPDAPRVRR